MVEIVISVASKAAEYLVDPICAPLRYLFKYRPNVEDLNKQIEKLDHARERVEKLVEEADRQGDKIFTEVTAWLEDAGGIIQKKADFEKDKEQASKSCFYLKSRYHLSKKAKKQAEDIDAKIQQARDFGDRVSHRPPPPPLMASTSSKSFEAFTSRQLIYNQIMEALRNEETGTIGVCGMGGVGKTTLSLQVAKQSEEEKLFDKVVMASSISQTPKIPEIQNEIAKMLGLTFEEGEGRAIRLCNSLKNQKKVLVILDDIWHKLDLRKIGIPHGVDHKGCKLLFTSRDRRVLEREMKAQLVFHLRHLDGEEAWSLFKRTAGDWVESPEFKSIAQDIVTNCEGLPVAIVTIAKALGGEKLPVWRNALEELKSVVPTNVDGVSEKVYSCLELSYNHLKGDEVKLIFLLCSLHEGGPIPMDRLLHYAMGLNLFKGLNSWEKATDKLITLVQKLKASNLLLDIKDEVDHGCKSLFFEKEVARMHDVVRDVARSIASKDAHQYKVREASELREWEMVGDCRNYKHISLKCKDTDELPHILVCPQLELFLMNNSSFETLRIPYAFFQDAKELRVLDLTGVYLRLGSLSNLRSLCLTECGVENIQAIGELRRLQVISLIGCRSISKLPKEMMHLSDLRVLDLQQCYCLSVIPRNLISSLSQLECLSLEGCKIEWERDGAETEERNMNACLSEIKGLTHLRNLKVEVSDPSLLPKDGVLFDVLNLTRYFIKIGWAKDVIVSMRLGQFSRILWMDDIKVHVLQNCLSKLLKTCQYLVLQRVNDIKNVVYELDKSGFLQLEHLRIKRCPNIQYILESDASMEWVPPRDTFGMLDELDLDSLNSLEAIFYFHGRAPIPMESFCNLRVLALWHCRGLKYVISLPTYHGRELTFFPQLQKLLLYYLPRLKSFYSTRTTEGNKESMTFFNQQATFPALEELDATGLDDVPALWHAQLAADSFPKLKLLGVGDATRLKAFSASALEALVQLEGLSIANCDELEEIVAVEDEVASLSLFPALTSLMLRNMSRLRRFFSQRIGLRWPLVKNLEVRYCGEVEVLFEEIGLEGDNTTQQPLFLVEKAAFPNLEELDLGIMTGVVEIWRGQFSSMVSFSKLSKLIIGHCDSISIVIPRNMVQALHNLECLRVESCSGVKEVIQLVLDEEEEPRDHEEIDFPRLRDLVLDDLPKLKSFSSAPHKFLRFQSLEQVRVVLCHDMEFFCEGGIYAPRLKPEGLNHDETRQCWERDLNTTIHNMFVQYRYPWKRIKEAHQSLDKNLPFYAY